MDFMAFFVSLHRINPSLKERCTDFGIAKRFVAFYSLPVNWGAKQYGVGKTICEAGIGRLGLIK